MEPPGRRYHCAGCHTAVLICSPCDHGQRYCAGNCAPQARACSMREAGRRYQKSHKGRRTHAARQSRYRARQAKVTHHASPPPAMPALLPANPTPCLESSSPLPWCCHFCGQQQKQFVRHDFLRRRIRRPLRLPDRRELPHDPDP